MKFSSPSGIESTFLSLTLDSEIKLGFPLNQCPVGLMNPDLSLRTPTWSNSGKASINNCCLVDFGFDATNLFAAMITRES